MKARLLQILVVLALLFGSAAAPAVAQANEPSTPTELATAGCHLVEANEQSGPTKQAPKPAGAFEHHHCAGGVVLPSAPLAEGPIMSSEEHYLALAKPLGSRNSAPLTQPPAA